jgi:2-dehydropantoate 2-reductase
VSGRRRYVIIGGGAVGGALAAQLGPASRAGGYDVILVARGDHGRLVSADGLRVRRPTGVEVVELDVATGPDEVRLRPGDVLLLTVKTQDAEAALSEWAWQPVYDERGAEVSSATELPIVTLQNGLLTEDLALRRFRHVYGATVAIAASYLTPGEIVSPSLPPAVGGIWLGRHPVGRDAVQELVVRDLVAAGFAAWSVDDITAQKAAKLAGNVGNGLDLLTGSEELKAQARAALRAEALEVIGAAGLPLPPDGSLDFHGVEFQVLPVDGHVPGRLSTWQSFARGATSEVDYLNGEVVLLARRFGLEAPLNERLQQLLGSPHHADRRTVEALIAPGRDDVAV